MKVFISWSGEPSKSVAVAFRDFLRDVIQNVKPFMSAHDIGAGTRWPERLNRELATTGFGVLCLTPKNQDERWILFEAGAISKALEHAWVCPYLLGLKPTDLKWPLAQFNANEVNESGTREIVRSLNTAMGDNGLDEDVLERSFNRCWKEYAKKLKDLPEPEEAPKRDPNEMLEEILSVIRNPPPTPMRETQVPTSEGHSIYLSKTPATVRFIGGPLENVVIRNHGSVLDVNVFGLLRKKTGWVLDSLVDITLKGKFITISGGASETRTLAGPVFKGIAPFNATYRLIAGTSTRSEETHTFKYVAIDPN